MCPVRSFKIKLKRDVLNFLVNFNVLTIAYFLKAETVVKSHNHFFEITLSYVQGAPNSRKCCK